MDTGLPSGMAEVARPNTKTEWLLHGAQTFESGKTARLLEVCDGQSITMRVLSAFYSAQW
jgi:hypothetical protein